jgi:hypothetical protein
MIELLPLPRKYLEVRAERILPPSDDIAERSKSRKCMMDPRLLP